MVGEQQTLNELMALNTWNVWPWARYLSKKIKREKAIPRKVKIRKPKELPNPFAPLLKLQKGDNEMSEEQTEKKRSGRRELFDTDLARALEALGKAQKYMEKAVGRLPKKVPKMFPEGTALSQRYKGVCLQDVFKDCNNAGKGKDEGVINGLMDTLEDIRKLAAGEAGFEF